MIFRSSESGTIGKIFTTQYPGFNNELVKLQRRQRFDAAAKSWNEMSTFPLAGEKIVPTTTL